MDINKAISIAILALVLVLAAVLTYFILAKVIAPPSKLHTGTPIVIYPLGTSGGASVIAWPPYFQLLNALRIYNAFRNYSLVYGPNTAPIKVLILYNPVMSPATNFSIINTNYILSTSKEGLVQYEIAFNILSFNYTGSPSPLVLAETNVASVAYCLYYNSTNMDDALLFLSKVGSFIGTNTTKVANLTSISTIQEMLNELGINMNVTECISEYKPYVSSNMYQAMIVSVINGYYVQPFLTPTPLTYQVPTNLPNLPILFMLGYNSVTGAYDDTTNNIQLPIFVQNLMTQSFMYKNLNG